MGVLQPGTSRKPHEERRVSRNNALVYYGSHSFTEAFDPRAWAQAVGQLGQDGWEMVSATATHNVDGDEVGGATMLYFKRRAGKTIQQPMLANL